MFTFIYLYMMIIWLSIISNESIYKEISKWQPITPGTVSQMTLIVSQYYNNLYRKDIYNGYFGIVHYVNNNTMHSRLPQSFRTMLLQRIIQINIWTSLQYGHYCIVITPLLWCHKIILRLIQLVTANRKPVFPYSKW